VISFRRERLAAARLYLVCDDRPDDLLHAALRGGVDIVQLRIKDGSDGQVLAVADRFARACAVHGALFILNDRPDLVLPAGADGVHLGQHDVPLARAREDVGSDRLIGLSTHTPAQVDAAARSGVDYIGVGPVHETPTKPGRPAVGLGLVRHAAAHARLPFFAIGGIDAGNVSAAAAAGAERVAVVRAIVESTEPQLTARQLRSALLERGAATARERVGAT
jgi:thiamine-phosphate pyrophosphorylase